MFSSNVTGARNHGPRFMAGGSLYHVLHEAQTSLHCIGFQKTLKALASRFEEKHQGDSRLDIKNLLAHPEIT